LIYVVTGWSVLITTERWKLSYNRPVLAVVLPDTVKLEHYRALWRKGIQMRILNKAILNTPNCGGHSPLSEASYFLRGMITMTYLLYIFD
jgi:hypothetical protein